MELIVKPTERCNFKCTFCSSTKIADSKSVELEHEKIFTFLKRFPHTNTIIVNGGDPLMMKPSYYWKIIKYLEDNNLDTTISLTTNLWPFYTKPSKWLSLFQHPRVGVCTSFQYGGGRLKGDFTEFSEKDFWNVSDKMLDLVGYRPDFISVITKENEDRAIDNVLLAKEMGVVCKLNYAVASGPEIKFLNGIKMGLENYTYLLADIYEIYLKIYKQGLADWEYNTTQLLKRFSSNTTCPQNRRCDSNIRNLNPGGDYYSCGAFGDDKEYEIDFDKEMNQSKVETPLQNSIELLSLKQACFTCPMFKICNGCKKTISDIKRLNLVEIHCKKMKKLAPEIIEICNLEDKLTEYIDESVYA